MLDLSDGLSSDLLHLLSESQVGAILDADSIPISKAARSMPGEKTPLERALHDGEDFELLFALSPEDGARLLESSRLGSTPVTRIGSITNGISALLRTGNEQIPLTRAGWEHPL
ncbi:MAG: AIR synthase-related protein [Planctomycetaceae bacterium]